MRNYIIEVLPQLEPALSLKSLVRPALDRQLTKKELKAVEDMLYRLICAYIAAHWWYWRSPKTRFLGDRDSGYIVIPNS